MNTFTKGFSEWGLYTLSDKINSYVKENNVKVVNTSLSTFAVGDETRYLALVVFEKIPVNTKIP